MGEFPSNAYGICPLGHNAVASGAVNDATSTHQISGTEEVPLFWSSKRQMHVCRLHLKEDEDEAIDRKRQERSNEEDNFRAQAGFVKTIN